MPEDMKCAEETKEFSVAGKEEEGGWGRRVKPACRGREEEAVREEMGKEGLLGEICPLKEDRGPRVEEALS